MDATQNTTKMPLPKSRHIHLLTIPPELRLQIYELVLADAIIVHRRIPIYCALRITIPPLLQVSKAIRDESIGMFNQRLSAILAEKEQMVADAESECQAFENRFARSPTYGNDIDVLGARNRVRRLREALAEARDVVEKERNTLRKEGFRI